jgi:two-component system CheB/CheR fusion protein
LTTQKSGSNIKNASETNIVNKFPIVAIGASAGGLDPIRKLLETLPVDTGMAFVVIQHLAAGQESMLPEILSRSTQMKVLQVTDGMMVEKNQVYVITPATTMTLKNALLKLTPKGDALKPINDFMISLSSERKTQAIGIILSGTGNDGTEGLRAIKVEGGITFVQDPETAQYSDMPKNAINAETAYFILTPENIAKELVRLSKNPQLTLPPSETPQKAEGETDLKKILMMLKASYGVDFTHYKETTINRRIARRRVINKIENNKEYAAFLRTHPNELQALFDDLLIGVTSFFREPKTFEALEEKVFPELVKNRGANESIRVWVPGCSTGEEVYSIAIAIQEFLEEKAKPEIRVQIFGTDANEKNIDKARQGIYPKTIEENISENKLKRFFSKQNGNYQITKLIRDMCIFAKQDITSDPPFSNLDLIMCRNVLIYFDSLLHERVFPIFHYGLKSNGFLVLGESESIGKFSYLFEPVTTKGLIYKKKRAQPQVFAHPETFVPYSFQKKVDKKLERQNFMVSLKEDVDRILMAEYVPATLLVSNNLDILFFRGQVNPYLTHEPGTASLNVTKMVRKELRTNVQTSVYLARKENKTQKETVQFKSDGEQKSVIIQVKPLKTPDYEEPFFLVTFQEPIVQLDNLALETETTRMPGEKESVKDKQINDLKADLESTKQSLQTIIEVQEATNEELRSTMEEAQSSNEELQSTNEELETAKEELQSGNEELQTLNEELKNRNLALGRLNDDLANLQTNLDIAVVIVDSNLRIRRFTAAAQELLRISPSDVGGSIANITPGVHIQNLDKTVTDVIDKLTPVSQEVEGLEGSFYEMRVRPYLTENKRIDGAFLSFMDITKRKKAEEALDKYAKNLKKLVEDRTRQLKDSERMAAIGQTAGMVGHDIRNPLQAITSDVFLARTDLGKLSTCKEKESVLESLVEIEKNIDYINKIVADLQDYSKVLTPVVKEVDLEALCNDVLFKNGITEKIDATCIVDSQARTLMSDPDLLKRILSNLVSNAIHAMPNGGKLAVQASMKAGEIVITVKDTGVGIPDDIKPKLFTPLFTTRAKGQGFGLAVVKRMTETLGGKVTFESQIGKGTTFTVRLPPPKELNGKWTYK